jgi:hypothetical protein
MLHILENLNFLYFFLKINMHMLLIVNVTCVNIILKTVIKSVILSRLDRSLFSIR